MRTQYCRKSYNCFDVLHIWTSRLSTAKQRAWRFQIASLINSVHHVGKHPGKTESYLHPAQNPFSIATFRLLSFVLPRKNLVTDCVTRRVGVIEPRHRFKFSADICTIAFWFRPLIAGVGTSGRVEQSAKTVLLDRENKILERKTVGHEAAHCVHNWHVFAPLC